MDALTSYFYMDGYAGFIWPAYAIVTAVLVGLWMISRRSSSVRGLPCSASTWRIRHSISPRLTSMTSDSGPKSAVKAKSAAARRTK